MNKIQKIYLSIVVFVLLLLIIFIFFALNIASISVPKEKIKFKTDKIEDTIFVYKNNFGIPHIISKNENDTYFMLGYLHAQNKLWLMDFMRRTAYGELSEIFGEETLNLDLFLRTLNIKSLSFYIYSKSDKNLKKILERYTDGINFFIDENIHRLSYEFALLDYTPEKWRAEDCFAVMKFLAFYYSQGFQLDMLFSEIASQNKTDSLNYFLPLSYINSPCILDDSIYKPLNIKPNETIKVDSSISYILKDPTLQISFENLNGCFNLLNNNVSIGSDGWVIKKNKKTRKGALLVSNSHHQFCTPNIWFPVIITKEQVTYFGITLPGIPFPFFGRNQYFSWAFINAQVDDVDYFIEKIDSKDTSYYINSLGERKNINYTTDTIKILNKSPYIYYRKSINNSFVINTNRNFKNEIIDNSFNLSKEYALTYKWTGNEFSNELNSLYKILNSQNFLQFKKALSEWGSPASTFLYSDINNNIGCVIAGLAPIRNHNCNSYLPNPKWIESQYWKKIINLSDHYSILNPSKHYVIASNIYFKQKDTNDIKLYNIFPFRAIRLDSLLNLSSYYSVQDMKFIQNEYYSLYAKEFLQFSVPIIEKKSLKLNNTEKKYLYFLKNWDYILSPHSFETVIYIFFVQKCYEQLYKDKLNKNLYEKYSTLTTLIYPNLQKHIINNEKIINPDFLLKCYKLAVKEFDEKFGNLDFNQRNYGKVNKSRLFNILELINIKKLKTFEEYYELGGDISTINYNQINFSEKEKPPIVSSMRFIADMQDTLVYLILVGGTSDEIFSPNYNDQTQLWINGGYISLPLSRYPNEKFKLFITVYPQ